MMHRSITLAAALVSMTASAFGQGMPLSARAASLPSFTTFSASEVRVAAAHGDVQITVPGASFTSRSLQAGEALPRGARVRVGDDGAARLSLSNGVSVTLQPGSELGLYTSLAGALSLEYGTLRVTSPSRCQRALALAAGPAKVFLGCGDAVVSVTNDQRAVRVATHRGSVRVRGAAGEYFVRAGHGVRQELGRRSSDHVLLPAPRWELAPESHVVTVGGPVRVGGTYRVDDRRRVGAWRVELAPDPSFRDPVRAEISPGARNRWDGQNLRAGVWYVRVSALDADRFEGPPSAPARVEVMGPEVIPGEPVSAGRAGRLAALRVPPGAHCGVDGTHLELITRPLTLSPARAHRVRCSLDGSLANAHETVVSATESGPVLYHLSARATTRREGLLTVMIADAQGYAIPYADVVVTADSGVSVASLREQDARGVYRTAIFWRAEVPSRVRVHVAINAQVSFDAEVTVAR